MLPPDGVFGARVGRTHAHCKRVSRSLLSLSLSTTHQRESWLTGVKLPCGRIETEHDQALPEYVSFSER